MHCPSLLSIKTQEGFNPDYGPCLWKHVRGEHPWVQHTDGDHVGEHVKHCKMFTGEIFRNKHEEGEMAGDKHILSFVQNVT